MASSTVKKTIAIMTDYGLANGFVGMLKGAILRIVPDVNIIDMTHDIESFDIRGAAFVLQKSISLYPDNTTFLAVVDPGVGSARRILAAKAGSYTFVAPDNGLLSYVLSDFATKEVVSVENVNFFQPTPSATFHGRDVMAPVAAHLANGLNFDELGPKIDSYTYLKMPNLLKHNQSVIGEIVFVDKFGNMVSNIKLSDFGKSDDLTKFSCTVGNTKGVRFASSYSAGDGLSAIVSGFGTVEIFVNQGSAASRFNKPVGTTVAVEG